MSLKLITYDLQSAPSQSYEALFEAIKSLGRWYHPQGSVWVVETQAQCGAIRDFLAPYLRSGDSLLVVEFEKWASQGLLMGDVARSMMNAA